MSQVIESLDIFKLIIIGFIQGLIIFVKAIFNVGYPTNILVFLLLFVAPIITLIKLRIR